MKFKQASIVTFFLFIGILFNVYSLSTEQQLFMDGISYYDDGDYSKAYSLFEQVNDQLGRYTARVTPYLVMAKWNQAQVDGERILLTEFQIHVEALKRFDLSDSIFKDELKIVLEDVEYAYDLMYNTVPECIRSLNYGKIDEINETYWNEQKQRTVKGSVYYKYIDLSGLLSRTEWALYYATDDYVTLSDSNLNKLLKAAKFRENDLGYRYGLQKYQSKFLGSDLFDNLFEDIELNTRKKIKLFTEEIIEGSDDDFNEWNVKYQQTFTEDQYYVDFQRERNLYLVDLEQERQEREAERRLRAAEREQEMQNKEFLEGLLNIGLPTVGILAGVGLAVSESGLANVGAYLVLGSIGFLIPQIALGEWLIKL